MTVTELIEELQRLPGHWPVTIEVEYNEGVQSVREVLFHRTLDVRRIGIVGAHAAPAPGWW